jgi:TPR repeat protein
MRHLTTIAGTRNFRSFAMACGLAACLLAQLAEAGPLEDGQAAYGSGDYSTALKLWQPLADQGNSYAQYGIGRIYFDGDGVPTDKVGAAKWFLKAAEQGDVDAQSYLAGINYYGEGVPQNYVEALRWSRPAAAKGNASAIGLLGLLYSLGQGVPQDNAEALKWFKLAADKGISNSQLNLGLMYEHGRGVSQDYVLAHMWFNLVSVNTTTSQIRGIALAGRDAVAAKMTPNQIAEAQRLARVWMAAHPSKPAQ